MGYLWQRANYRIFGILSNVVEQWGRTSPHILHTFWSVYLPMGSDRPPLAAGELYIPPMSASKWKGLQAVCHTIRRCYIGGSLQEFKSLDQTQDIPDKR